MIVDFFGNRQAQTISRNEFYYFVDCFFRGLSKALIAQTVSISFDQSFSESFTGLASFEGAAPALGPPKGEFFRMVTGGGDSCPLTTDILKIVGDIFLESASLAKGDFVRRMQSRPLKFVSFLESIHRTFQTKNELCSMKFFKNNNF